MRQRGGHAKGPGSRNSGNGASDRQQTGLWGERQAERYLRRSGYRILGRRVRVGRRDEIDLLMRTRDTLIFVEVKTRRDETFARAAAAVDRHKRHVLSRAAVRYLQRLRRKPPYIRFDVVEVVGKPDGGKPLIRHLENVFPLDSCYSLQW